MVRPENSRVVLRYTSFLHAGKCGVTGALISDKTRLYSSFSVVLLKGTFTEQTVCYWGIVSALQLTQGLVG